MRKIKTLLTVDYFKLTKEKWDNVLIITGDEGTGKSNLGLHCLDYWYFMVNGQVTEEDIKHVCLDMKQYITDLKDLIRYDMIVYDEAGELSNLRVMNKFNYRLTQAYQVIRALNINTILILPSIFDLNPFFTMRRARGLLHVYKRGRVAFWNKKRLRKMIMINKGRKIKNIWVERPLWRDNYPIYDGVLKKPYDLKKEEKIKNIREELYKDFYDDEDEINSDIEAISKGSRDYLVY